MTRITTLRRLMVVLVVLVLATEGLADGLPLVPKVELQPLSTQAKQVVEALELLGEPVHDGVKRQLAAACANPDHAQGPGRSKRRSIRCTCSAWRSTRKASSRRCLARRRRAWRSTVSGCFWSRSTTRPA